MKNRIAKTCLVCWVAVFAFAFISRTVSGQSGDSKRHTDESGINYDYRKYYEIEISPSKLRRADRKRRFLQSDADLKKGNAAIYYYRACLAWHRVPTDVRQLLWDKRDEWLKCKLDDFPITETATYLDKFKNVFQEIDIATKYRDCQWANVPEDFAGFAQYSLHEFSTLRALSYLNRLRIRHAVATGDLETANQYIAQGLQMAIHVGEMPVTVAGLVGEAIARNSLDAALELSGLPGSPNNLLSLQSLPQAIVDFMPKMEMELDVLERSFEFLDSPAESDRTAEQWRTLFVSAMDRMNRIYNIDAMVKKNLTEESRDIRTSLMLARLYPVAKRELLDKGWDEKQVNEMPVGKVVAIQTRFVWDEIRHLVSEGRNLATQNAFRLHQKRKRELNSDGYLASSTRGDFPVSDLFYAHSDLVPSGARYLNRRVVMMQNLERLRDFAAQNNTLPSETQYLELEMATDPRTGIAFEYKRETASKASLQTESKRIQRRPRYRGADIRMEIKLKK